jgi:peptidyl-dipeptidase Dcp
MAVFRPLVWAAAALFLSSDRAYVVSPQATSGQAGQARVNPLLSESTLPYGAPDFLRIQDADYAPALIEGMSEQAAEVDRIASNPAAPTFENTIEALERSGALLTRVSRIFGALGDANTNPTLQRTETEMAPRLAAHRDAISLNSDLFARVKRLYDQRDRLGLEPEQRRALERYYQNYVRSGAALADAQKSDLKALNREQSELMTTFRNRVLADMNAKSPAFESVADLDGLPRDDLAAAASAASSRALPGKWVLPLQNTTQQPAQTWLTNRDVRQRLFIASTSRNRGGDNETAQVIARLAQLRAQRAKLLGYDTHAAFTLETQMAKTPDRALKLLTDLVPAVTTRATQEAARIQTLIDQQHGGFTLQPWDWQYYAEQVRKADYDLDESQVRPYFELNRVLVDGVFFAATAMYGVTFKARTDIPVYHPDVRVFEVFDRDGSPLGLFYGDYFARPSKRGGAWTTSFVAQSRMLGTKTVTTNTCNFTKPAPGAPALISADDVRTMFHEFGHALNGLFSEVEYPTLNALPRDFVEVPSQFNEHWALEPRVFANYAHHYQTGAPMPAELEAKIRRTQTFNQGFATGELLSASFLDLAWHTLPASAPPQVVDTFEAAALNRDKVAFPQIPPRYSSRYFSHIWSNGYSAGYYSYLWSAVIDTDAYYWFNEHGGMTRENGQRFRDKVLSKGNTIDADVMYRDFRGRDPDVTPLLIDRGLQSPRP